MFELTISDARGFMWKSGYDAVNRIVTMQDGPTRVTMTYDDNGNLTAENRAGVVSSYAYNPEDQLIEATIGVDWAVYEYNGDGKRVIAQDMQNDQIRRFHWDGDDYLSEAIE